MSVEDDGSDGYRSPPYWLLIGTYAAPLLFVWLFLRRCYRPSLRRAAFTFAVPMVAMSLIGTLAS